MIFYNYRDQFQI